MNFLELLYGAEVLVQSGNPGIGGLEYDSRRIKPGDLFVAMRGESSDGNKFIDQAIAAGAVAIVTDSATEKPRPDVAWAQVPHGRRALARLSANFYKKPAERLASYRHHRHQRQEHDCFPAGIDSGCGGPQERPDRDHRVPRRGKDSAGAAHYARSLGAESHSGRSAGPRRNRSCDGSFVARAGAAASVWHSIRRCGLSPT